MQTETIEEYLKRGGRIKRIQPQDNRFASHRTRYHFNQLQYVSKSSVGATAPGTSAGSPAGRIEPRSPGKPWPNLKKNRY
jgi:hypothetical protein